MEIVIEASLITDDNEMHIASNRMHKSSMKTR